jgi:hypothetical protein
VLLLLFKIYVWLMQIDQYVFIHLAPRVGITFVFAIFMTLDHCSSITLTSETIEPWKNIYSWEDYENLGLTTLPLTSLDFIDAVDLLFWVVSAEKSGFSGCSIFVFSDEFNTIWGTYHEPVHAQSSSVFFQSPAWPKLCSGFFRMHQEKYVMLCSHIYGSMHKSHAT